MENLETTINYHAAMFKAVGRQTKFSRSGYSVVFAAPQAGRSDLSGNPSIALEQLRSAGIDPDAVTEADIAAYEQWRDGLYQARRVGQARILVTRKFGAARGHSEVPANRVSLIDGWGETLASSVIECQENYDPDGTNRIGGKGAYYSTPDYSRIEASIAKLRKAFPEFSDAPVVDNNLKVS